MGELSCGTAQRVTNAVLLAVVAFGLAPGLNAQNKACGLATPDELQAVLGTKAPELKGQSLRGGDTEFCTGTFPRRAWSSVTKKDEVAAIEITAKSQKDMLSIDALRPLAEKMSGDFRKWFVPGRPSLPLGQAVLSNPGGVVRVSRLGVDVGVHAIVHSTVLRQPHHQVLSRSEDLAAREILVALQLKRHLPLRGGNHDDTIANLAALDGDLRFVRRH